jgi:hypothetical protein
LTISYTLCYNNPTETGSPTAPVSVLEDLHTTHEKSFHRNAIEKRRN